MWVVVAVIVSVLLSVGLYAALVSSGIVPGPQSGGGTDPGVAGRTNYRNLSGRRVGQSDTGLFGIFPRVPHLRELPQGCLLALIVASALWFIAWTVLLVLAFGLLRSIT